MGLRSSKTCAQVAVWLGVILVMFLPLSTVTAHAQDYRAKLAVVVKDTTGAVISNATLKLEQGSTRQITTAKTNATGTYTFQFLDPDTYRVTASAPTMGTAVVNDIVLQAYASSSITVVLKPKTASTTVTVRSEGALLQTRTASRAFTIGHKDVTNLPVINGNPVMLGEEVPGVYMRPLGIYTDPWTVTSQYLINGGLMYLNEFEIDGQPNDAELGANTYAYTPPQYAVKQFTVSANNYNAEYGHTSGGVINLTTMSGGAQLHGMGWSSFRRTGWNANTYQNKYENSIHNTNANKTPFNSQTQLGFEVGGPIFIPRVIPRSAHYKPFFFFAFDHYSELLPRGLLLSYPTAKMRTGDFSQLLSYGVKIYDPATGHIDNNPSSPTYGDYVRDPFPGNIIPPSRLNPIALKIASAFPQVGSTPAGQRPGTNDLSLPNNYYNWHFHNLLGRFSLDVGQKYKFFLRPEYDKFTEVSNAGGIVGPGENGGHFSRAAKGFLIGMIDVINPTTVLNAQYGYTLFRVQWSSPPNQGVDLTSLGYPSSFVNSLQQPKFYGDYTFQNYNSIGWFTSLEDTGTRSLEGDLSKSMGRTNLHMGWDVRLIHYTSVHPGFFTFNSNSAFTDSNFNTTGVEATSGDSFATFLLGTPSGGNTVINAKKFISTWYLAPWIQDDWQVRQNLMLNLGFRYDVLTAPVDRGNQINVGFDPNIPNATQAQVPASAYSELPQAASLTGGLLFANVDGNPRSPFATVYHNIQPRFGFAWQPVRRLVVRGGYGLFYTNFQNNGMIQQMGFSSSTPLVTSNDGGRTPISNVLNNPYPDGLIQPTGSSLGTLTGVGQTLTTYNRHYKIPDANEFSLGFQYRVFHNSVFSAAYVGNRVVGYDMSYDANLPSWNFQQKCDEIYAKGNINTCNAQQANPFQGVPAFEGTNFYSAPTLSAYNLHRPHPEFLAVNTSGLNQGHNWYNGLQLNYTQRMTHGVSFNASYVWSKQIEQWGWMNQALNLRQRSPYTEGLPQVFKVFGVWELPIGRGKLINIRNRVANEALGGWEFSADYTAQSGEPAALPGNAIPLPHNKFYQHPDWSKEQVRGWNGCVLDYNPNGAPTIPGGPNGVTAKQCGTNPNNYDWLEVQTLPRERTLPFNSSILRMKPMIESDAAIQKSFTIHHSVHAIIRLQASNVLNHFNLLRARFNTNPNAPPNLFGTVIQGQTPTADSPPRNVNVQVRIRF